MPVRVELRPEAVDDLVRYATSGNLTLFLKKLLRLEAVGKDAGQPLGRGLTGWRKIVVGDRNWRIIFATDPDETIATVWVIGDRDDNACYEEAQHRVKTLGKNRPEAVSLAAAMFQISWAQILEKKQRRKRT
ncbi:MAG: type II toxin-antitoxin system RelE/ParE family toxin [Chloroflexia bacterium]|nr:type II toxin-antitoxin system RelE/ParE family toxin [Chloroflexia bacterium]